MGGSGIVTMVEGDHQMRIASSIDNGTGINETLAGGGA